MRCHIELIGHLSATPEIRPLPNGGRLALLTVETSESWRDRDSGERKSRSTWHDVRVTKSGAVKAIERLLNAGDLVFVSGSLRYSDWTDAGGTRRKTAEIAVRASEHQLLFLSRAGQSPDG